ncbi:MAG: 50S ribosomal protein L22 [Candidatus Levybacteria bacterium GW2011_GWA2_40_8]|nr:MAG: 50S ribosomal protein L22 [Candidatus Levybacteria bacterium GW2011_GWA2_40_8]
MEQVQALANSIRISPRKVRIVADMIRKMSLTDALDSLTVLRKRGGYELEKTLKSAISNAKNNSNLSEESLKIKSITVTDGPFLKRFRPSTRGRVHPYKRRSTNIRIVLEGEKKNGTKS